MGGLIPVKLKYVIVSPRQKYGGAIVLHALCKYLSDEGYDAKIFYTNIYVYRKWHKIRFWIKWIIGTVIDLFKSAAVRILGEKARNYGVFFNGYIDVSITGCKRKIIPYIDNNTVVVYPDVIYGNFLNARMVVRWLLSFYKFADEEEAYGKNDFFFAYRKIFDNEKLNPGKHRLCISYFNLDMYKQTNFGKRNGCCYIIRKGNSRKDLPEEFNGVIIDNLPEKEKVRIFNESKYCISYDLQTAYSQIAALCGCISVVIPEPGKKREDYRLGDDNGYGEAFGFNEQEINYAKKTATKLLKLYREKNNESRKEVIYFIKECEKYFG